MSRTAKLLSCLWLLGWLTDLTFVVAAEQLNQAEIEIVEWFDSLGFPDLSKTKFVRVSFGGLPLDDAPPVNHYIFAFLLNEHEDRFTVFTPTLVSHTYRKMPDGTTEHSKVTFELADLRKEAAAEIRRLNSPPKSDEDPWRRFGEKLSERAEVFVLARGCAAQGLHEQAHQLIVAAANMPGRRGGQPSGMNGLKTALSNEIGQAMMWRAVEDFGEPENSRKELLARLRHFLEKFPDSEYVDRAKATAELLAKMVKEDEEHAAKPLKPLEEMPTSERVSELIFQLRDQNGHQFSQPGFCNIFADPRDGFFGEPGKGKSPASQLVALSYDAIPQLIEAIDDRRCTRCVEFHRNFYFSHHVLSVGHCAVAIIENISGRKFFVRKYNIPIATAETKEQIQRWWVEFQRKGERQTLIENVAQGDDNSVTSARRLVEKYPDVALNAIRDGIAASFQSHTRAGLVELAAGLKDEAITDLLLGELKNGPYISARITAAWAVHRRGRVEAVPAMIHEWKRHGRDDSEGEATSLILFLAQCGNSEAVQALGNDLEKCSVDLRIKVVAAFGKQIGNFSLSSSGPGGGLDIPDESQEFTKDTAPVIEALLVRSLTDTGERLGMSGSWNGKSFADPRICDIAAHVLNMRFKNKYDFDLAANLPERDRQLVVLRNIWRKEHNLEPLPFPKPRINPGLPSEKTQPLLAKVASAETAAQRAMRIAELESLGIAALPAVRDFIKSLPRDHASQSELSSFATRLANTVVEVVVRPDLAITDSALAGKLTRMKGIQLSAATFCGLLREVVRDLPKGSTGAIVSAYRFNDSTGVRLTVLLTEDFAQRGGSQKGWSTNERVTIAEQEVHNSQGFLSLEHALTVEAHAVLGKSIEKALAASASDSFLISASLRLER